MEEKKKNVETTLNWLDKTFAFIKKIGIQNIFLTIMMLFLVVVTSEAVFAPEKLVKRVEEIISQRHTESVIKRLNNETEIRQHLSMLKKEANADRVYILETHNGGTNLAGLPFLYVDLTYAEPQNTLSWLETEYRNVRLSRYPWATEVYTHSFYAEPVEYLENIDPELYYRLKNEDVKYMAAIIMYGTYNPSGVLGVVYTDINKVPDKDDIKKILIKYCSRLSILFNNE